MQIKIDTESVHYDSSSLGSVRSKYSRSSERTTTHTLLPQRAAPAKRTIWNFTIGRMRFSNVSYLDSHGS
jgi:hypothetical protein